MTAALKSRASAKNALLGPAGPTVDESNMVFFGNTGHAGPVVHFDFSAARVVRREPLVDLFAQSSRWKVLDGGPGKVGALHLAASLAMHGVAFGVILAAGALLKSESIIKDEEETVVEVAFGFDVDTKAASAAPSRLGDSAADQQATKTEQQLPQLPKQIAVESAPPDAQNMPLPPTETLPETPPKDAQNTAQSKPEEAKPALKETPPPGVRALTPEELARRAERESRKVAKEEQSGTHSTPGTGRVTRLSDVPDAPPFNNDAVDVPPLPSTLPQGSLDGKVDASVKAEYTTSARNHIRRVWSLPNLQNFEPDIKAEISFQLNIFGRLVGEPRLKKGSGNPEFDAAALQAIKDAVPFPELPKELAPTQNMTLVLWPPDARN